ncbi:TPA: restriction endonuclease subunit S [Vibrio alginolyticus]|uniref:restriction endonuclease subunit S n=1 Tax=Vibrio sp. Vb1018 TaxID=3074636 RepID=UPI002964AACF|nr:restriction endonuclease subunit S [Vibrio sp. Vb1018]MDW1822434.1 restriction endonuclease subunit S [Vibrio sp. Vb1018]
MSFETATLDSLCELVVDCPHSTPKWTDEGIIVLRNQNIKNGVLDLSAPSFTNEEDYQKRIKRAAPKAGDIVFTREAPMGEVCMIPEGLKCCLGQRQVLLRPKSDVNGQYLFWALQSPYVQQQIAWNEGTGSTVSNVRIPVLKALNIPRIGNEDMVAKSLSDIASKMALNTQTNQTLEQMAQAIFKSWFVDFDPVKAKMNGELPEGMDAATASLFPEKLVESELGLIPDGWELTNIGKVSECFDKKRIPLSKRQREQKQGSIPYYGATSVMDYVDEAIFDDIYLLIGEDGSVMKDDGTPFIQYIWGPAWVNNHAHVLQGIKPVSTEQLMLFFQQTNINAYVTGAVQLKINQRNMNSIPFIKASKEINERFYDVVAPLYAKIRAIKEENEQLAKLRDTLLPKLLSGEIELDVEKVNTND